VCCQKRVVWFLEKKGSKKKAGDAGKGPIEIDCSSQERGPKKKRKLKFQNPKIIVERTFAHSQIFQNGNSREKHRKRVGGVGMFQRRGESAGDRFLRGSVLSGEAWGSSKKTPERGGWRKKDVKKTLIFFTGAQCVCFARKKKKRS